jgi:hypothetical protein
VVVIEMRRIVVNMTIPSDGLRKVELLIAELKAIEHWDASYWRGGRTQMVETLAYTARGRRRAEILSQLRNLISQLNDDHLNPLGTKKPTQMTDGKV